MDERITQERKDRLVEMFADTAYLLTNEDALEIVKIMERACDRASIELEEDMLIASLNGEEIGGEEQ